MTTVDPCLDCTLPDCDEGDRRCGLSVALNKVSNARRRGEAVSEIDRARFNVAYTARYADRRNERRRAG